MMIISPYDEKAGAPQRQDDEYMQAFKRLVDNSFQSDEDMTWCSSWFYKIFDGAEYKMGMAITYSTDKNHYILWFSLPDEDGKLTTIVPIPKFNCTLTSEFNKGRLQEHIRHNGPSPSLLRVIQTSSNGKNFLFRFELHDISLCPQSFLHGRKSFDRFWCEFIEKIYCRHISHSEPLPLLTQIAAEPKRKKKFFYGILENSFTKTSPAQMIQCNSLAYQKDVDQTCHYLRIEEAFGYRYLEMSYKLLHVQ